METVTDGCHGIATSGPRSPPHEVLTLKNAARAALVLAALPLLAGCSLFSPACAPAVAPCEAAASGEVPCFGLDGRLRRDLETDAPVFAARPEALAARAPRFNDDGSVARDPESGAPLYEELRGGLVARVLVAMP